jgi:hypothetical protein
MKHEAAVHGLVGKLMKEEAAFAEGSYGTLGIDESREMARMKARMQTTIAQLNLKLRAALEAVADVNAETDAIDV